MKALATALLGALSLFGVAQAQTTTLSLSLRADDAFWAWLGTSRTDPGTLLGSGNGWTRTYRFTASLKPGQAYYLHIKGRNTGGPCGLIAALHLSSPAFRFANGGQDTVTGPAGWSANPANSNPIPWAEPTGPVRSFGANGALPWGWVAGMAPTAQWIWPVAGCNVPWVNFSTTITPATPALGARPSKRARQGAALSR